MPKPNPENSTDGQAAGAPAEAAAAADVPQELLAPVAGGSYVCDPATGVLTRTAGPVAAKE